MSYSSAILKLLVRVFFFNIDICHLFPQCMLAAIPFIGGVTDVVMTKACTEY